MKIEELKVFEFENGETEWIIAESEEEAKLYYETLVGQEEMAEFDISELKEWQNNVMREETTEKQEDGTYWRKLTMLEAAKEMYSQGYTGATLIATTCI